MSTVKNISIKVNNISETQSFGNPRVDIFKEKIPKVDRLMRRTRYQARLGRKLDHITRKILDNGIRLSSHPTDMIRIRAIRDEKSQDLISRTIESAEIVPIIFPNMEEIPLRRIVREDSKNVLVPSLYPFGNNDGKGQVWTIQFPAKVQLNEDDLLLRVIYEEECDDEYVLCLQVKQVLSTIGYSGVLYTSADVTIYDEKLPDKIIGLIRDANLKRDLVGY